MRLRNLRVLMWCCLFSNLAVDGPYALAQPQEKLPRLAIGRFGMPAVGVGNIIYVVGGYSIQGLLSDVERIDTTAKPLEISDLKPDLVARGFHTAESSGPYIYIMGGLDRFGACTEIVERLDTRDMKVERMAPMPEGLRTAASEIVDGKIYVAGGSNKDGEWVDTLLIYDIATNAWKYGAHMTVKKECDLLAWQGKLIAIGGFDGKVATVGIQSYDIASDRWSSMPNLPIETSAYHGCVVSDSDGTESVVLFGDYAQLNRVQSGNPDTGQWHLIANSPFQPARHAAVVKFGHKIYVIGGNVNSAGSNLDYIQALEDQDFLPTN